MSFQIESLSDCEQFADTIAAWIVNEWSGDAAETKRLMLAAQELPATFVAISQATPVGVIGFKLYPAPDTQTPALWINALFVVPTQRGQGIGSQLLQRGSEFAASFGARQLYVLTDQPAFYEHHSWEREKQHSDELWVLQRAVA